MSVLKGITIKLPEATVDRTDFSVYRRNDRQMIEFIAPRR
jgi:hypothetical protein